MTKSIQTDSESGVGLSALLGGIFMMKEFTGEQHKADALRLQFLGHRFERYEARRGWVSEQWTFDGLSRGEMYRAVN
mgnify:FL=1